MAACGHFRFGPLTEISHTYTTGTLAIYILLEMTQLFYNTTRNYFSPGSIFLLQIMKLILAGLLCGLLVPRSYAVLECNDSATSWIDSDMYSLNKMMTSNGENSLTCLAADGLQNYTEATVCDKSFKKVKSFICLNLRYCLLYCFIHSYRFMFSRQWWH